MTILPRFPASSGIEKSKISVVIINGDTASNFTGAQSHPLGQRIRRGKKLTLNLIDNLVRNRQSKRRHCLVTRQIGLLNLGLREIA